VHGARVISAFRALLPGILVSALVAMAAQFVSEHYGAPAMLMALAFGMALNFLSEQGSFTAPGITFTARDILKLGVVLLGARISFEMVAELGWQTFALVVTATVATLLAGLAIGRMMRKDTAFSVLTAGAVAICGASAALAISSVLPKTERSEQQLFFTVLCVTLLSTLAMVFYPVALSALDLSETEAGVFLGATIHDVAQVVGAGFLVSDEAGKTATLVKLTRVALLAPVVIAISILVRGKPDPGAPASSRPPLLPLFVAGFLALAALNSFGLIPEEAKDIAITISRWALLAAIAAVGLKSSLKSVMSLGGLAVCLVIAESLFLAAFVLAGLSFIT
jgi:uncharacterized integral membrane protein (TIGR00698 family)